MSIPIMRFDPRTKIVYALCMSVMALFINRISFLLPLLFAALLIAVYFCRGGNFPFSARRLRRFAGLFVMIALIQSVFSPSGRSLISLFGVSFLTAGGLLAGCRLLLRMSLIVLSAAVIATEDGRRTIQGLIQWKMPYELAFMTLTALHFIPIFADGFEVSLTALKLRGVDFKKIRLGSRLRAYASLLYPVIAGMITKSQDMALAMEMRGFRACPSRTSYITLSLSGRDYAAMAVICVCTVFLIAAAIWL